MLDNAGMQIIFWTIFIGFGKFVKLIQNLTVGWKSSLKIVLCSITLREQHLTQSGQE